MFGKFKEKAKQTATRLDVGINKTSAVSSRLASGLGGVRPRIRGDNLSRQVLEDSYRVDTRNMYR